MPQTILGIDIGSYSVKVAEIERSLRTFELVSFFEKVIQYNEILTPEESATIALTTLIEEHSLAWDTAICAMPGQEVSCRLISFPFGSVKKIDQTIEFELENYIPLNVENVIVDYYVVHSSKESSDVLVAYTKKDDFLRRLKLVNDAGVDPRYICVEGIEMVSLMNLGMIPPEAVYAIVDVGHKKATITFCEGKKLLFTRCVSLAGEHLTMAIADKLDIPPDEAEKIKVEVGRISVDDTDVMDDFSRRVVETIKEQIDELLLHIRQTIFSFRSEHGKIVEGIFICGGTSRLPGLDRYFSIKLKQNVTHLDCLQFHFSRLTASDVHRQVLPQSLALALRGVAVAGLPDVNFRRGEFVYKGDVEQFGGGIKHLALVLAFMLFVGIAHFSIKYYSLQRKVSRIQFEVAQLVSQALPGTPKHMISDASRALSILEGKRREMQESIDKLNSDFGVSVLEVLKQFSESLPPRGELKIDVDRFSIVRDKIKISGRTDSFGSVDKIRTALERNPYFDEVTTGNVRKGIKGEVKFDISMALSPNRD